MRGSLAANLAALTVVFAPLSLMSFGGANAVLADIAHQSVSVYHWTSGREFADLFALSRAAPGPGSMLAALIGWKVAGIAGALAGTLAFHLPSAVLVYGASRLWGRWRGSRWHTAVEEGLAPVAAGLFLSGGIAVLQAAPTRLPMWIAALAVAALLLRWPKLHPVPLLLAAGAMFGLFGAA